MNVWDRIWGRLDGQFQELCCYLRPKWVEIVGVFAGDSLEEAHLTVLWDYRPGVLSFAEFVVVTCQLAVCTTRLLWGTRSVCGKPHLAKSNRWKSWVTFSDVFGNCRQVVKLYITSAFNNSKSRYRRG